MSEGISNGNDDEGILEMQNSISWLSANLKYLTIFLLPVFSFASYLIFLKSKYNYFEHLILNFYIAGQQTIIYLVFSILFFIFKIKNDLLSFIPIILSSFYLFWVYIKFFNTKKSAIIILKTIFTQILYYFLVTFMIIIIGVIAIILINLK